MREPFLCELCDEDVIDSKGWHAHVCPKPEAPALKNNELGWDIAKPAKDADIIASGKRVIEKHKELLKNLSDDPARDAGAREWWIRKYLWVYARPNSPPGNQIVYTVDGPDAGDPADAVHVIEYAAYADINARLKTQLEIDKRSQDRLMNLEQELANAQAMYADQRHAYNAQKKFIGEERAKSAALIEALEQIIPRISGCIHMNHPIYVREQDGSVTSIQQKTPEGEAYDIAHEALVKWNKE